MKTQTQFNKAKRIRNDKILCKEIMNCLQEVLL